MTAVAGAPVVVGVDGSTRSLAAVELATAEAALRHRALRIVHAFTWPPVTTALNPALAGPSLPVFRDAAHSYVAEAARLARQVGPDVRITSEIVAGSAVPVLLAESRQADLLVLGERGSGGFTGLLVGSVAVQAAGHAACPVLVVRGPHRPDGPVVAGVDGSPTSTVALELAAQEAALRGAELVALHAWTADTGTELNDALPSGVEYWSEEDMERRVLAEALGGIADRYPDLRIRRQVRRGSARRLLAEWSLTAQLVVVGDRGHGGFAGLLLGSVSQYLIYRAGCPTLVARPALVGVAQR